MEGIRDEPGEQAWVLFVWEWEAGWEGKKGRQNKKSRKSRHCSRRQAPACLPPMPTEGILKGRVRTAALVTATQPISSLSSQRNLKEQTQQQTSQLMECCGLTLSPATVHVSRIKEASLTQLKCPLVCLFPRDKETHSKGWFELLLFQQHYGSCIH